LSHTLSKDRYFEEKSLLYKKKYAHHSATPEPAIALQTATHFMESSQENKAGLSTTLIFKV